MVDKTRELYNEQGCEKTLQTEYCTDTRNGLYVGYGLGWYGFSVGSKRQVSLYSPMHRYFQQVCLGETSQTKRAKDVVEAFRSIVEEGRKPKTLRSDAGSEYTNKVIQNFLKNKGIHHYVTHNTTQASYAERVLKTIKTKLYRYMVSNYTSRYINVLQDIINSYNATVHRSLGRAPKDVSPGNQAEVRTEQYVIKNKPKKYNRDRTIRKPLRYTFSIDDKVRISTRREAFSREYSTRFTGEIFTIYIRYKRDGIPVYKVTDWSGEKVEGAFYEAELQKVTVDQNTRYNFTTAQNSQKLQRIQNRAIRIITKTDKTTSTTELQNKLKLQPLHRRWQNQLPTLMHIRSRNPIHTQTAHRTTRQTSKYNIKIPRPKTQLLKNAPCYKGAQIWNALPEAHKALELRPFKKYIKHKTETSTPTHT